MRGVAPRECELRQHIFIFGQGFTGRAVVDNVQRWLAGKEKEKGSQVFLKSFAGVDDVDFRVCSYPAPLVISFVPTHCRAQYYDVRKRVFVAYLKEV